MQGITVDREIFGGRNFRLLNFRVNLISSLQHTDEILTRRNFKRDKILTRASSIYGLHILARTAGVRMESLQKESCIRGYHIYQHLWTAAIGEHLMCQRERGNAADAYAISVMKGGTIVGHLPRRISCACTLFIRRGGTIGCQVTGRRKYSSDLRQGGLEIPCLLTFEGEAKEIKKFIKLFGIKR